MLPIIIRNGRQLLQQCRPVITVVCNISSSKCQQADSLSAEDKDDNGSATKIVDTGLFASYSDEIKPINKDRKSVLEKCDEDLSFVAPYLRPTFNFAAYINKCEALQELLKMGVNLHKVEKIKDAPNYILRLNFEKDIKKHIIFLHDLGLSIEAIAKVITKNPFIFKEDLENLRVRINYLKYKRFSDDMILRIVENNPNFLSQTTQNIDKMLGFIQKQFNLNANELRIVAAKKPTFITYNQNHVTRNIFVVREEMGFTSDELKKIVLKCPVIFMKNQHFILRTFEYIHRNMGISLETISEVPEVLTCREYRVKQRHLYLVKLGKAQFDPKKPNYVSIVTLVSGNDSDFCTEVAKSSVQAYNAFLKTL